MNITEIVKKIYAPKTGKDKLRERLARAKLYDDIIKKFIGEIEYNFDDINKGIIFDDVNTDPSKVIKGIDFLIGSDILERYFNDLEEKNEIRTLVKGRAILSDIDSFGFLKQEQDKIEQEHQQLTGERIQISILILTAIGIIITIISMFISHNNNTNKNNQINPSENIQHLQKSNK